MIIYRKLQQNEKLFGVSRSDQLDRLLNRSIMIAEETLKLIEFHFKDGGEYLKHWSKRLSGFICETISDQTNAYSVYVNALNNEDGGTILTEGDFLRFRRKFRNADDFITKVKLATINDDDNKYKRFVNKLSDFKLDNEDYQFIFKYISLCLCGELRPNDLNYWQHRYQTNFDYLHRFPTIDKLPDEFRFENNDVDRLKIQNIITDCINNVTEELKPVLDPPKES